jgi:hypothetical protein
MGSEGPELLRVDALEDRSLRCDRIELRGRVHAVSIGTHVFGTERVETHENDVTRGNVRFTGAADNDKYHARKLRDSNVSTVHDDTV